MAVLAELKLQGKIRYIGLTNFSLNDLEAARKVVTVESFQGLYNLIEHNPKAYHNIPLAYRSQSEILPYVQENRMMFLPYSPIMQGLLTDDFDTAQMDESDVRNSNPKLVGNDAKPYWEMAEKLQTYSKAINKSLAQIAINWLIQQPGMGPIISGALIPEHVEVSAATTDWQLSEGQLRDLDGILENFKLS